jgi:large subunit ribosomal protein L21
MYAVIKTGGKQYKVAIGDKLKLELIPSDIGSKVELTDVLMIVNQDQVRIGSPVIGGASVTASVVSQGRHKKVRIFKMRRRKHYQKHQGHRQYYTEVSIDAING